MKWVREKDAFEKYVEDMDGEQQMLNVRAMEDRLLMWQGMVAYLFS